jgi:adenylate cyclase
VVATTRVSDESPHRALSLRFVDADMEGRFQEQYFRDNIRYVRVALRIAIVGWAFFGIFMPPAGGHGSYLLITLVGGVGLTSVALMLTYSRRFQRSWQPTVVALVVVMPVLSELHRMLTRHPSDWGGVVGLMLVLAFAYALLRLQYRYAALAGLVAIASYNGTRVLIETPGDIGLIRPDVYLVAFAVVGTAAAFALERFARLLFVRERDVDRERERGDVLLRNILPETVIGVLKMREPGVDYARIAERYAEATVLFADLVGFTERAAHMDPDDLIVALDEVFGRWDRFADRFGLEKIKTIGDAYMAAAGVPTLHHHHAAAAAAMAIEIREDVRSLRWPNGAGMSVRIGIASGPVIAGVIGRRKFAYDIWGDTVNAASRLQTTAPPGAIQVPAGFSVDVGNEYVFSAPYEVDLKGKGPTAARILIGRASDRPAGAVVPTGATKI